MSAVDITLYGTRACSYCNSARRLLTERNLPYQDIALDDDPRLREEIRQRSGRKTIPQIWIGDWHVGGFDDLSHLERSGELSRRLSATIDGETDYPGSEIGAAEKTVSY